MDFCLDIKFLLCNKTLSGWGFFCIFALQVINSPLHLLRSSIHHLQNIFEKLPEFAMSGINGIRYWDFTTVWTIKKYHHQYKISEESTQGLSLIIESIYQRSSKRLISPNHMLQTTANEKFRAFALFSWLVFFWKVHNEWDSHLFKSEILIHYTVLPGQKYLFFLQYSLPKKPPKTVSILIPI